MSMIQLGLLLSPMLVVQEPPQVLVVPSNIVPTPPSRYRQETLCKNNGTGYIRQSQERFGWLLRYFKASPSISGDWVVLCQGDFINAMDIVLAQVASTVRVVQIGAHIGFEGNDPLASGILNYIELLSKQERRRFQWTFVEANTANFRSLRTNLADHAHLGVDLRPIHAGVVPDSMINVTDMTFYSIRDTIDHTGFDSLSRKTFPSWVTQISSFSLATILKPQHKSAWTELGLKIEDYVIQNKVTSRRYSDLLQDFLQGDDPATSLVLVLIDTEGFDCHIVNGIAANSSYLPQFLIFEQMHCERKDYQAAMEHLQSMGYTTYPVNENTVAHRQLPQPQSMTLTAS
jgi:hypothetical protein